MADISDDSPESAITSTESAAEIQDKEQQRRFRTCSFYGSCLIIFSFLLCLLYWLAWWPIHSFNLKYFAGGIDDPEKYADFIKQTKHLWVTGIVALATIPTTLALALLRFSFSSSVGENKGSELPSVWLSLAKEVIDVVKEYVKGKTK